MNSLPSAKADRCPLLSLRGIHKRFPGVHALKGVDLDVSAGEVHAVVGENGAGKSTLMQILSGVYPADAGRIDLDGRQDIVFADEQSAQQCGIAIVYQERSLFGSMSVAENVFAARQPVTRWGRIDHRQLAVQTKKLLDAVGLDVPIDAPVETLSPAQQQLVEIAKALSLEPKLIIFDEPTAALTQAETDTLFGICRELRDRSVGILYITHRLEEIFTIADRVTVLKDGVGQGTFDIHTLSLSDLLVKMVGREVNPHLSRPTPPPSDGRTVLEVAGLSDRPRQPPRRPRLLGIGLSIRVGEILGLAGLVGSGRTELALAVFGARSSVIGEVRLDGQPMGFRSPSDAVAAGIGYLPEDRKSDGLFLDLSIEENIAAAAGSQFGNWWYNSGRRRQACESLCRALGIVCRDPAEPVRNLSGGNQQKVVLARWLLARLRILIADEPTRGVDVGAKSEIHNLLYQLADDGKAILLISSDLPEALAVSDRILVLREGRVAGGLSRVEANEESVMRLAAVSQGTLA
jgi:ABC-type sugar transport system ATPase subunit